MSKHKKKEQLYKETNKTDIRQEDEKQIFAETLVDIQNEQHEDSDKLPWNQN